MTTGNPGVLTIALMEQSLQCAMASVSASGKDGFHVDIVRYVHRFTWGSFCLCHY